MEGKALLKSIEKTINFMAESHKELGEIRVSVDNYKNLMQELKPEVKEKDVLLTPLTYKGIKITWGVEMKWTNQ